MEGNTTFQRKLSKLRTLRKAARIDDVSRWKPSVGKLQPVQDRRLHKAHQYGLQVKDAGDSVEKVGVLRTASSKEMIANLSMYFGWLGNSYKGLLNRADEAVYTLEELYHSVNAVRRVAGMESLKESEYLVILNTVSRVCEKLTEDMGIRDYVYVPCNDTSIPWMQISDRVYLLDSGTITPDKHRGPTIRGAIRDGTPAERTYIFNDGELQGNASVPIDVSDYIFDNMLLGRQFCSAHVEVNDDGEYEAVFILVTDIEAAEAYDHSTTRMDNGYDSPMGGLSRRILRPVSKYETILSGFFSSFFVGVSEEGLKSVHQFVRKCLEDGASRPEEDLGLSVTDLNNLLGHQININSSMYALTAALMRRKIMRREQRAGTDVAKLPGIEVQGPNVIIAAAGSEVYLRCPRERDTWLAWLIMTLYAVATVASTFRDDKTSEGLKVIPAAVAFVVVVVSYYHTAVHKRDLRDFFLGGRKFKSLSEALEHVPEEVIMPELLAHRHPEHLVDGVDCCYLTNEKREGMAIDREYRISKLESFGAQMGVADTGELVFRSNRSRPWRLVTGDEQQVHVTDVEVERCAPARWRIDPVVKGETSRSSAGGEASRESRMEELDGTTL